MASKDGGEMCQRGEVPVGNDIREVTLKNLLRGGGGVGLLTLCLGVGSIGVGIRSEPHSPEFEFAAITSELLEQAMYVLPVSFASVPHVVGLDQRRLGSRGHERGGGRRGG